jgi:hypothetical protein
LSSRTNVRDLRKISVGVYLRFVEGVKITGALKSHRAEKELNSWAVKISGDFISPQSSL